MKKINHNFCIFICIAILIVGGWFSRVMLSGFKDALIGFVEDHSISAFISDIDKASNDISYKGALLDLYSLYYRVRNVRVVEKSDETVLRLENDYLSVKRTPLDTATLEDIGDDCADLKDVADSVDADFMYVMVPSKSYYNETEEIDSPVRQEYTTYGDILRDRGIHVLDLADRMKQKNLTFEDSYFITDHHWVPETGFWASEQIMQELNKDRDYPYDEKTYDLDNYDVKVYEDWFLGSLGKKVGRYFTPLGVDDFSLITPKFETEFTVTDSYGKRNGTFAETIVNIPKINRKGHYTQNPYAQYCYGGYGLQVIENENAGADAKKIVIIRDSFASCSIPYIALSAAETHSIDIRYWDGEMEQTIPEYIKEVDPDCVIVLYSIIAEKMTEFFE